MKALIVTLAALAGLTAPALAQNAIVRIPNANPQAPILSGVVVPAGSTLVYLSGQVPAAADKTLPTDSVAAYGDTKTQAISVFEKTKALLAAQNLALSDVIKLTVFLVGDPKLGGKLDFKGFGEAYALYFGTTAQPNKTARSVVQVSALANPGYLVEIEAIAATKR